MGHFHARLFRGLGLVLLAPARSRRRLGLSAVPEPTSRWPGGGCAGGCGCKGQPRAGWGGGCRMMMLDIVGKRVPVVSVPGCHRCH